MFTIVSAYGIRKSPASEWETQDISAMPSSEVFTVFRQLYLTLTPDGMSQDIVVDIEVLRNEYAGNQETLQELLLLRTEAIPTTTLPNYKAERCVFIDARKAGYTVNKALPGGASDSAALEQDKVELQISRPNTDMELFARKCLVTVNGFLHKVQASDKKAFVNNGARSLFTKAKNYVGILSFEKIGDINCYPIAEEDIFPSLPLTPLKSGLHIDYKGPSLVGKSVLLVLGGYIHFQDFGVFRQIGESTFSVSPSAIPLVKRYQESKDCLDLSGMQDPAEDSTDRSIDVDKLYSDESLTYYLTHPNSFFLVVDTPSLTYQTSELHSLKIPGRLFAYKQPTELMLIGAGRCAEYWSVKDDGIWAVNIDPSYHGTNMFDTVRTVSPTQAGITAGVATYDGYQNHRATMLDIIADTVVVP